ncbi:hypothetical protein [Streptomyces chartreusis]|uniref:hypothetical protein n=1 Tax=Streptomyces chartreusis TaxID=1969 RepID=UPI00363169F0
MIQPLPLAIGFGLGAVLSVLIRALAPHMTRSRVRLPVSVASVSPELATAMSLAVAERHPNLGGFDYAAVSVIVPNSPEKMVYLYPARGPHRGAVRLDSRDPSSPGGRAARLLAEMSLPHAGVVVIPLGSR